MLFEVRQKTRYTLGPSHPTAAQARKSKEQKRYRLILSRGLAYKKH